jgi:hypothetical protein
MLFATLSIARDEGLSKWGVGSCSPAAWSAREIEQALATLAALAQICAPSAAHFLKSHQLLVQKFAADRDRQKGRVSLMEGRYHVLSVRSVTTSRSGEPLVLTGPKNGEPPVAGVPACVERLETWLRSIR